MSGDLTGLCLSICQTKQNPTILSNPEKYFQSFFFQSQLKCCSVHVGKYNPATFEKHTGIKLPCYTPNDAQPDEGCEAPIEATWGPAKPCR